MGDIFMAESNHSLVIYNREKIEVGDVLEILSSTEKEIYVKLSSEILQIFGERMKINKLSPDDKSLCVNGRINGVNYISKVAKKSFLKKVFK